jgi:sulfatase maturation enzyme AslB (radical SAM superfamily)
MKQIDAYRVWGRVLGGYYPMLSVEITRECPLRCPGCYAYEPEHLGQLGPLRTLADYKGQQLIDGMLALVRRYRPVHISIVGGEPLVRFRELDVLLPRLSDMGIEVQLVTSAVRPIPPGWASIKELHLVVSIDGLQAEHDLRRAPATYERILQNIAGHRVIVHCTVTHQMAKDPTSFEAFLTFWSDRAEVRKIWFSLFTPQIGDTAEEILPKQERAQVLTELARLRPLFPKLHLPNMVIDGFRRPPQNPSECIFARTTLSITADLQGRILPCQFGGNPDCSQCGCIASAGLKAVGDYRLLGALPIKSIFFASDRIGAVIARMLGRPRPDNNVGSAAPSR